MLLGARTAAMTSNGGDDMLLVSQLVDGSIAGDIVVSSTKIKRYAFDGCRNLTSISSDTATIIEAGAFTNCGNIVSISMPNVTLFEGTANPFQNDWVLEYLDLRSVTSLPGNIFAYCGASGSAEKTVHIEGARTFVSGSLNLQREKFNFYVGFTCSDFMALTNFPFMAKTSCKFYCTDGYLSYESGAWTPHYNAVAREGGGIS